MSTRQPALGKGRRKAHATEGGLKFLVSIVRDEDGMFIAECPAIPGCVSQGRTEQEAEENVREAIRECLAVRAEKGMPLTVRVRQVVVHL